MKKAAVDEHVVSIGALDSENARRAAEALSAHAANGGAVLIATHDDRLDKIAAKVLFMRDGTLTGAG